MEIFSYINLNNYYNFRYLRLFFILFLICNLNIDILRHRLVEVILRSNHYSNIW